jgi:hypothetical protein
LQSTGTTLLILPPPYTTLIDAEKEELCAAKLKDSNGNLADKA